jgi:hypothetical protein
MSRATAELLYGAIHDDIDEDEENCDDGPLDLHQWIDQHFSDLSEAMTDIVEHREQTGELLFDACDFGEFCEAMYLASDKRAFP